MLLLTKPKQNMRLSIKLTFLFFLFCILTVIAQEDESLGNEQEQYEKFHIYAGLNNNFPIGNGFITDAYKLKIGVEVGGEFMISKYFFGGIQFDLFRANAIKPEKLAGVQETKIVSSSLHLGYKFNLRKKLDLSLIAGLGHARYANEPFLGNTFHDDAFFIYAQPRLTYLFAKNWSFYLAAAVRNDNLKIKTSPDFQEYFNNSTRIPVSAGVQLSL